MVGRVSVIARVVLADAWTHGEFLTGYVAAKLGVGEVDVGRCAVVGRHGDLRSGHGDRCMSLFHAPDGDVPLVFGSGKWTREDEGTVPCGSGGMTHIKITAEFPLPDPLQDPIPVLTGHGQNVSTGSTCPGGDFEDKFVRTGD